MATVKVDLAPTDEEDSGSSDTEERARGLTHAVLMSHREAEICKDEAEEDSYSYTSVHPVKCDDMLYPPRGLAHYDLSSLSCGLLCTTITTLVSPPMSSKKRSVWRRKPSAKD